MDDVTTAEARKNLADLLNRVAYAQERVTVTRRGRGIATIVPVGEVTLADRLKRFLSRREVAQALDQLDKEETALWVELKKELGL